MLNYTLKRLIQLSVVGTHCTLVSKCLCLMTIKQVTSKAFVEEQRAFQQQKTKQTKCSHDTSFYTRAQT